MKAVVIWLISLVGLGLTPVAFAATLLEPVTIGYSTFSGAHLPLSIAIEERLGAKHGRQTSISVFSRAAVFRDGFPQRLRTM